MNKSSFESTLIQSARDARLHAIATYSHFSVGAALFCLDGTIVTGCNIENATYGLTVCAERVALFKALSDGKREFSHIAIVADTPQLTPPCGACRQLLWEFCGDLKILLANLHDVCQNYDLKALFPEPFDGRFLN